MQLHEFYTLVEAVKDTTKNTITHNGLLVLSDGADAILEDDAINTVGASLLDENDEQPFTKETFAAEIDAYLALSGHSPNDQLLRGEAIAKIIENLSAPQD